MLSKEGSKVCSMAFMPSFFVLKTGKEVNGMRGLRKECNELTVEEILYLAEQGYEFIVKGGVLIQVPAKNVD